MILEIKSTRFFKQFFSAIQKKIKIEDVHVSKIECIIFSYSKVQPFLFGSVLYQTYFHS